MQCGSVRCESDMYLQLANSDFSTPSIFKKYYTIRICPKSVTQNIEKFRNTVNWMELLIF